MLASEASIAIENARLFQEERTKARHLSSAQPDFARRYCHSESGRNAGQDYRTTGKRPALTTTSESPCSTTPPANWSIQAESGKRRGALGQPAASRCGPCRPSGAHWQTSDLPLRFATTQSGLKPVLPDSADGHGFADFLRGPVARRAVRGNAGARGLFRGRIAAAAHAGRPDFRRAAQRADLPEGAGTGHHRRPDRRQDASLLHGSALLGMEAFYARRAFLSRWC